MNITLRKANTLQNAINDAVKNIDVTAEISINEFQDAEQEVLKAVTKLKTNIGRRDALTTALYQIRQAVGQANSAAGVDRKLAEIARLEKEVNFYAAFVSKSERLATEVLAGKLDKIRNRKEDSRASLYGMGESVETSVLTNSDIDGFKTVVTLAKKAKQRLQDELLELNVRTTIELSTESERVLQAEGLI
jgi:galactokinase/mevalonate kinase-like predicted kinase